MKGYWGWPLKDLSKDLPNIKKAQMQLLPLCNRHHQRFRISPMTSNIRGKCFLYQIWVQWKPFKWVSSKHGTGKRWNSRMTWPIGWWSLWVNPALTFIISLQSLQRRYWPTSPGCQSIWYPLSLCTSKHCTAIDWGLSLHTSVILDECISQGHGKWGGKLSCPHDHICWRTVILRLWSLGISIVCQLETC